MSQFEEQNYDKPFDIRIFKKLLPFFKPLRKYMVLLCFTSILASGIDMAIPLFMRSAINDFIEKQTLSGLLPYGVFYFLVIALQVISAVWFARLALRIEMLLGRDMKRALFVRLQELSFSYYNTTPVGYSHTRVMSDTGRIGGLAAWGLLDGAWSLAYAAGVMIIMFRLNARLALMVVTIIPLVAVLTALFRKRMLNSHREVRKNNSQITRAYNESISGARTSKVLVIEGQNQREFQGLTSDFYSSSMRANMLQAGFIPLVAFCGSLAVAFVLTRGGKLTMAGAMEIGTLSVFVSYATSIFDPIQNLARLVTDIISAQASVERVTDLLEKPSDIQDSPAVIETYGDCFTAKKENWEPLKGDIRFCDVSFRYPDGEDYVLEHFNLEIPAGTTVAIVGETGAGKSTIVNLACRFFEPTEGQILIDGRDYRERSQLWLHSNIGYVLQNPHLFSGSIRENIRYGKLDATDAEIEAAAEQVSAHKVAQRLEKGYDTDVGESGDLLSTGEKQLISYARAIIAQPPIFVLDEATSSIDTETERLIQQATETLLKGRTSFIIAHRLSTIKTADIILVVKEGKIIERGSHRELMQAHGYYHELYTKQFEEDVWERELQAR